MRCRYKTKRATIAERSKSTYASRILFAERHPEENSEDRCDNTTSELPLSKHFIHLILYALLPPQAVPRVRQRSVELLELGAVLSGLVLHGVKVLDEVGDVIIIVICSCVRWSLLVLLDSLVGLGELTQRCERVGSELIEDTGNELRELLHLTGTVNGEGVGGKGRVDCEYDAGGARSAQSG